MPRKGGRRRSGSKPVSGPIPLAVRRILLQQQQRLSTSSVEGTSSGGSVSGSKSMASEGSVSSSSSSSLSGSYSYSESDSDSDSDSDGQISYEAFKYNPEGQLVASLAKRMRHYGQMLLLFETPSGFALLSFFRGHCYLPDSVNDIWAKFGDYLKAICVVSQKGFRSFEDKSSAINADTGVDKKLVDLINDWRLPGMKLCVGKPEYKVIIESKLKIPCMYCQTVMEIMWGIENQIRKLVPQEKAVLTKQDRLPMSQGLRKFLNRNGFDVKPEMVNEKIVAAASTLFYCDADDRRNLFFLRETGLYIRDISGISCEGWDILKLAIAVKVICCPDEELTDFHEVLAEDELSKLKGDALKYNGIIGRSNWLRTCKAALSTYNLRIAKKKFLESSLVNKEAYEAEEKHACEMGNKLQGESPRPPTVPVTPSSLSNPSTSLVGDPSTCLAGEVVIRRSPRLNPKLYQNQNSGGVSMLGSPARKRTKYSTTTTRL